MFLTSILPQWTAALVSALLAALSARPAAALLTTPTIELYSAHSQPVSPGSVYADFTKCVFSGYAGDAVTLGGPVVLAYQSLGMVANAEFIATTASPFVADTAIGYMLSDGAANLYLAEDFPQPVAFGVVGAFLVLSFVAPLGLSNASNA